MSEPVHHFFCANHPGFATRAACVDCGRPFCESCLTEMSGQLLCGWCRDQRLGRIQQRSTVNPATVVLLARIFNAAALVMTVGFAALFLGYMGFISSVVASAPNASRSNGEPSVEMIAAIFGVVTVLSLLLYLPPAIGLGPRRGWLWAWQMVALGFAVLGGCVTISGFGVALAAPGIVLFVFWVKPEVRDYCSAGG